MKSIVSQIKIKFGFLTKSTPLTIAILLLLIGLRWGGMYGFYINGDGKGYYAYLPATFIYHDYQFKFFSTLEAKYYSSNSKTDFQAKLKDGKLVNMCYVGVAILWVPFFLIAHFLSLLFGWPADGFAPAYQISVLISSVFYLWIGLFYLRKLLLSFNFTIASSNLILWLTTLASPVIFYTIINPEYTHIYSFTLITIFLFYSRKYIEFKNGKDFVLSAAILALIILVRPINGIIIFVLPFIAGNWKNLSQAILHAINQFKILLVGIASFGVILLVQLVYYKLETGSWLVWSYGNVGFNFKDPHFIDVLFSYRKGFFIYTPFAFLTLLGFVQLFIKNKFQSLALLAFLVVLVYLISSWWCWSYGMCFSMRPMTEFMPLFAILLGFAFDLITVRILKILYGILLIFTMVLNLTMVYQYVNYILHWDNMNKEKYWKIFFRTSNEYRLLVWTDFPKISEELLPHTSIDTVLFANSIILDKKSPNSPCLPTMLVSIADSLSDTTYFFMSAKIKPLTIPIGKLFWAASVQRNDSFILDKSYEINMFPLYKNKWYRISKLVKIPKPGNNKDFLKISLRNGTSRKVAVDSLVMEKVYFK